MIFIPKHRLGLLTLVLAIFGGVGTLAITCARVSGPEDAELRRGQQAHLHITIEGADATYQLENDDDPWASESWVTDANVFDLVVENRGKTTAGDARVLVTVHAAAVDDDSWEIVLDGESYSWGSVFSSNPAAAGLGGGSHGVYEPSGDGVYTVHDGGDIPSGNIWRIPVEIHASEGFEVHFDAASTAYRNPASHDVNVRPEPMAGGGSAPPPGDDVLNPGGTSGEPPPPETDLERAAP